MFECKEETIPEMCFRYSENRKRVLANKDTYNRALKIHEAVTATGFLGCSVEPGTYDVDFSVPGFNRARAESVVVSVFEAPSLAAQLEVRTNRRSSHLSLVSYWLHLGPSP
jgi:hypothetical protein